MEIETVHIQPCVNFVSVLAMLQTTLTLPSHADDKLTAQQSAEIIADHFASISQDYDPILFENFTPKMRESLSCPDMAVIPVLQEYQVYERVCKAKKPNSTVPGD